MDAGEAEAGAESYMVVGSLSSEYHPTRKVAGDERADQGGDSGKTGLGETLRVPTHTPSGQRGCCRSNTVPIKSFKSYNSPSLQAG